MEMLHDSGLVTSLDLVELNPFLDERGKTALLMVDLAASLMGLFYAPAQNPAVAGIADSLLTSDPRYTRQNTPNWSLPLSSGQVLTGLNSYPLRSSGAAFAHAAGLTGRALAGHYRQGSPAPGSRCRQAHDISGSGP